MRTLIIGIVAVSVLGITAPAQAGAPKHAVKYKIEGGVKVYRHGPTPQQIHARQARYVNALQAQQQLAHQQANAQAFARAQAAQQGAFERGFIAGQKQAVEAAPRRSTRRRYGYGRRYSTYNGFRPYYRPAHHSRFRSSTRRHRH